MDNNSWRVPVTQILNSELGSQEQINITGRLQNEEDIRIEAPVKVKGQISNAGDKILADLEIDAKIGLTCSRCAKDFEQNFSNNIKTYFSYNNVESPIDKDGNIDLTNTIRETIILNIPIKRLCQENCKGIK